MKLTKYAGAAVVAAFILFLFVAYFSSVESRFRCSGDISSQGGSQPITIYMKLNEYRWWVGLWSDSDGSVWLEIPNRTLEYFERVVEIGDQLRFYEQKEPRGHFSALSKNLAVITISWSFDGTCKKIEK